MSPKQTFVHTHEQTHTHEADNKFSECLPAAETSFLNNNTWISVKDAEIHTDINSTEPLSCFSQTRLSHLNRKRQEILVEIFRALPQYVKTSFVPTFL